MGYVNDIQFCINKEYVKLFADDTGVFIFDADILNLMRVATKCSKDLTTWFHANRLALSVDKCNFIIFHGIKK